MSTTAPTVKLDITRDGGNVRYVYAFCSACSYWHGFAWTIDDAYAQGDRHLIAVHDVSPELLSNRRRNREAARAS